MVSQWPIWVIASFRFLSAHVNFELSPEEAKATNDALQHVLDLETAIVLRRLDLVEQQQDPKSLKGRFVQFWVRKIVDEIVLHRDFKIDAQLALDALEQWANHMIDSVTAEEEAEVLNVRSVTAAEFIPAGKPVYIEDGKAYSTQPPVLPTE